MPRVTRLLFYSIHLCEILLPKIGQLFLAPHRMAVSPLLLMSSAIASWSFIKRRVVSAPESHFSAGIFDTMFIYGGRSFLSFKKPAAVFGLL